MADNPDEIIEKLLLTNAQQETIGGTGGSPFEPQESTILNGPISMLKLRSGHEIDNIEILYNGETDGPHGGGGGSPGSFSIPSDYDIYKINTRHGHRVDALQFIAKPLTGSGASVTSDKFGGDGGTAETITANNGLVLRSITGRSGDRVDALTFHFGYPYRVENVIVDVDALRSQLVDADLIGIDSITYRNATDHDSSANFNHSKTISISNTARFETSVRALFGLSVETGATVGVVENKTTVNFELETTFTIGHESTVTEQTEKSWDINIPLPARNDTTATIQIYEAQVTDVPFTYDIVFYEDVNGKAQEIERVQLVGYLSGTVPSSEVVVNVHSEPIPEEVLLAYIKRNGTSMQMIHSGF